MNRKLLETAGCMIYACEGTKLRRDFRGKNTYIYAVEVTNSTPEVISVFARFLREIIEVDKTKLRGQLFIYEEMDEECIKEFWSNVSGIPLGQFQKTIIFATKISKFKPSKYGTFKLRYSSKRDFLDIQERIAKVWRDARAVE